MSSWVDMAPEVARGETPASPSDVFALGATLYAAVEGTPPFGLHDNPLALLHMVAGGKVRPPAKAGPLTPVLLTLLNGGLTPASIVDDSPTTWEFDDQIWTPENYEKTYDGPITLRRALAQSRNIATIKVAEQIGFDRVAALWHKLGVGTTPKGYPSIALGVFEATPLEIATAYTIFPNMGNVRPLRHLFS